jgi:hypothetical protein
MSSQSRYFIIRDVCDDNAAFIARVALASIKFVPFSRKRAVPITR